MGITTVASMKKSHDDDGLRIADDDVYVEGKPREGRASRNRKDEADCFSQLMPEELKQLCRGTSGLEADLNPTPAQHQTGLSILLVPYILMRVPPNLLLNYVNLPSLPAGFFTTAWGPASAPTSLFTNYGQIVACLFLLALAGPFFPGAISKWYTKKELALYMSIFYSGSLISGAFGNLIAAGILKCLNGARGLAPWQWLYIIETPGNYSHQSSNMSSPTDAFPLNPRKTTSPLQPSRWGTATPSALSSAAPPYIFREAYSLIHSHLSDRFRQPLLLLHLSHPYNHSRFKIFMKTDNNAFSPLYFSFSLMMFIFAMKGTCYSWAVASAIPRPPAKRATAYAFINSAGNSTSMWTSFTYRERSGQAVFPPGTGCKHWPVGSRGGHGVVDEGVFDLEE
ncbi:hypothetical protein PAAG_08516 [Paracoccidioides lutzii Pb01]|uniref:Uncharacterized protein n=1 Tax=Paracoccidioides lutzii (strain ATCC MYA-826 / Pb01) TaxID=502779 RepID=C1HCM5_PARBA|nr:hypothetical protein PAAG_08516 [Paracoccidioides lutzii Pb01]EEH38789.2 hypothetical protein PAAG_08516 [Paracoccidioides lutzii Pb01]